MEAFIGRKAERVSLQQALASPKAEMIAIIGRRRVGKTFLVQNTYRKELLFELTGIQHATESQQLRIFADQMHRLTGQKMEPPQDWLDAFMQLKDGLEPLLDEHQKRVIFFDELPWLASADSDFLGALGFFWNSWASKKNLLVVICGSASSWIIQKVINHKGGLHNRVTRHLHLKPFTLAETRAFFQARNIHFNLYQTVQLYMALGGIPLYLEAVQPGKSAAQNIDEICFSETGLLKNEFSRLYPSLFEQADHHIEIIRALAKKRKGLSRTEIIAQSKALNGGRTSQILEELLQSDFIMAYHPYGKKKKDKLFRLVDEYSLFYLRFMEGKTYAGKGTWLQISQTQEYKVWCGYAYENICMKHIPAIKQALGISGVYTTTYSFLKKPTSSTQGLQVDLLLDRADNVINLFEVKFYHSPFSLTAAAASQLRERVQRFQELSKTRKQVFLTLITTFGLKPNPHSLGLVEQVLSLEDLFLA